MKQKIELLSPVGNFKSLIAAIKGGADAIYFGLKQFNMRDTARNFTIKDIEKINKIIKQSGKKIKKYLTLNTIIYDSELKKVENIIKKIKNKVDAIICWDLSVVKLCKKYKIPFHISTQASVSNSKTAEFYKKLGAKRIILARELNLKQIKKISKIIDTEVFVHGAMCVSISGRCFTSQFLHNRSANRGKCQQPCRGSYVVIDEKGNKLKLENNKVFSAKDLCTLPFIEKLKKSGAVAFKIEGRNREPEYVYTVTKIYKQGIKKKLTKQQLEQGLKDLKQVYNREFSSGFYFKIPTSDDFTKSEHGSALRTKKIIGKVLHYWKKQKVAKVKIFAGKLKQGDIIQITGNTTFFQKKIESMQIEHKPVEQVSKGCEVGIKLPYCRKNDEVYLIIKKR